MKTIIALAAVAALSLSPVAASAQDHHRHGGNTTQAAILGAVGGIALGVAGSAIIHNTARSNYNQGYQAGASTYAQPYSQPYVAPQPVYQPSYQPTYQAQPAYPSSGYGYSDPYAQPVVVARPRLLPPPNGVRCLMWNGQRYAPIAC